MLLATILCLILGLPLLYIGLTMKRNSYVGPCETGPSVFGIVFLAVFVGFIVAIPLSRWATNDFCKEVQATQTTLNDARKNNKLTEFERATLTADIISINRAIASKQNKLKVFRSKLWIHPDVSKLKYVK